MKKLLTLLTALLLSGALAQPPVSNVGVLIDYTGALAEFGPALRNSAELAAAQINAAAEVVFGGPLIRLIHEDSATSPAVGADRARKLIEIDGVVAIVGSLASSVTVAVAEAVTAPARVVQISPSSTSPLLTFLNDDDFLFRTTASDALQGVVAAQLARGELVAGHSFETASVLFVNNAYGQGLAEQFRRSFEARGGRVLAMVPVPEAPAPTYAAELERALAAGPDVLIPVLYPGHAVVALTEARDLFNYTSFQYLDALRSLDVLQTLGETGVGQLGTVQGADAGRPGFRQFAAYYQARFGEPPPLAFMDTTYDACAVAGLAIAGVVAAGLEPTPLNLRDQLRAVAGPPGEIVSVGEFARAFELLAAGQEIDYSGAAGEVDLNQQGEVATAIEIWRFSEDGFETVMLRRAEEIPSE